MTIINPFQRSLEMQESYKELGSSWGGKVCEVPVDNVDVFFSKNEELFLDAGRKAYLRAMGIPPSFFEKQPTTLQSDILTSQKSELREKSDGIYILVDGDSHVAYAGAATEAGWQDPYESFGIDQESWIPTRVDERAWFVQVCPASG